MNKTILVAGAGHGGLLASAYLARAGYTVKVFEKNKECDLGHDWEDRFTYTLVNDLLYKDVLSDAFRVRGDCAFFSPNQHKKIDIHFTDKTAHRVVWRKKVISELITYAKECGVQFFFETTVQKAICDKDKKVVGLKTSIGDMIGNLVIDSAGVFSPVRQNLPDALGIEKKPKYGDLFYAYRAYYNLLDDYKTDIPFEVYLYHEGERGLSWHCTNPDSVDILIGRIYRLDQKKVNEQLDIFRVKRPWTGDKILSGGKYSVIPVRRPLTKFVADGYVAIGDSAFMTTPMNGMGIDLSLLAGALLATTILQNGGDMSIRTLWLFNKDFHRKYGGDTAKNEGLKNAILSMPSQGVDFLFENDVIQASDLAGAGKNINAKILMGKFARGMRNPKYFFALIKGLVKGSKASKLYKNAPQNYDEKKINAWSKKISKLDILVSGR